MGLSHRLFIMYSMLCALSTFSKPSAAMNCESVLVGWVSFIERDQPSNQQPKPINRRKSDVVQFEAAPIEALNLGQLLNLEAQRKRIILPLHFNADMEKKDNQFIHRIDRESQGEYSEVESIYRLSRVLSNNGAISGLKIWRDSMLNRSSENISHSIYELVAANALSYLPYSVDLTLDSTRAGLRSMDLIVYNRSTRKPYMLVEVKRTHSFNLENSFQSCWDKAREIRKEFPKLKRTAVIYADFPDSNVVYHATDNFYRMNTNDHADYIIHEQLSQEIRDEGNLIANIFFKTIRVRSGFENPPLDTVVVIDEKKGKYIKFTRYPTTTFVWWMSQGDYLNEDSAYLR